MKHFEIEHNSGDWYAARAGVATSSEFDRIVTKTGKLSSQSEGYANKLIAELILGRPIDRGFSVYSMEWGEAHEEEARRLYKFDTGLDIRPGGFFTNDSMTRGASPDARVYEGDKLVGLAEIKCPENPAKHVEFLLMQEMNPEYKPQVQGQLLVSGCEWVDWFSYYPEMPPARIRVYRDEAFIAILDQALKDFEDLVISKLNRLVELGHIDDVPKKEIGAGKVDEVEDDLSRYLGA